MVDLLSLDYNASTDGANEQIGEFSVTLTSHNVIRVYFTLK